MPDPDPPSAPPTVPGELRAPHNPGVLDDYHKIADTVGGVPNLRVKDNLIQTAIIIGTTVVLGGLGYLLCEFGVIAAEPGLGAIIGAVGGLVLSTLLSGFVLMILGWSRALRK
ncbi:MAG: hypothetical protein SFY69_02820 [Planctomycetota bacterium]|nr:hypothetical protein [Planctomycetota bacterium]